MIFHRLFRIATVLTVVFAVASCGTVPQADDHDHEHRADEHHGHDHGSGDGRILVGTTTGTVAVLDAHDGDVEAMFPNLLPEGILAVYANTSGEFGYAVNRAASVVAIIDSGQMLVEHDGHEDLVFGEISILGYIHDGLLPTHFTTTVGRSGLYNDGSGDITIIDESYLRDHLNVDFVPARVDHGAPVLLSDRLLVAYVGETFLEVMDYDGTVHQVLGNVARAHGQARVGRYSAFGAVDGVFVVTQTGIIFDADLIPNPADTPDGVRTGTVYAHPRLGHFVGNLGDGLVKIDPAAKVSTAYALPTRPWRFGIDRSGHYIVVLGFDGVVYVLDSESFEIQGSVAAVAARDANAPSGTPIPAMTLGRRIAYVSDPATNRILEIHLDDAEIEEVFAVDIDGTITSIALMTTDGIVH